jgi:hypothetical protein
VHGFGGGMVFEQSEICKKRGERMITFLEAERGLC